MQTFKDQTGVEIWLEDVPQRIVSLTPSITELLFDLGLNQQVVGITNYCAYPEVKTRQKERIGELKNPDVEKIRALSPDLIIGNKRENLKGVVDELRQDFPVWLSDVNCIEDACNMIRSVGEMVEKQPSAQWLATKIEERFAGLESDQKNNVRRVAYLVWRKPWMAAGATTFSSSLLELAGLSNVFRGQDGYPEITDKQLREVDPELVMLPSEPYHFNERNVLEIRLLCPGAAVSLVDGQLLSWYGSRLLRTPDYLRALKDDLF
jgi:ABC-type Fe3+-hydroxamate transport system substrate-binding protein